MGNAFTDKYYFLLLKYLNYDITKHYETNKNEMTEFKYITSNILNSNLISASKEIAENKSNKNLDYNMLNLPNNITPTYIRKLISAYKEIISYGVMSATNISLIETNDINIFFRIRWFIFNSYIKGNSLLEDTNMKPHINDVFEFIKKSISIVDNLKLYDNIIKNSNLSFRRDTIYYINEKEAFYCDFDFYKNFYVEYIDEYYFVNGFKIDDLYLIENDKKKYPFNSKTILSDNLKLMYSNKIINYVSRLISSKLNVDNKFVESISLNYTENINTNVYEFSIEVYDHDFINFLYDILEKHNFGYDIPLNDLFGITKNQILEMSSEIKLTMEDVIEIINEDEY